jgi:putative transposase
VQLRYGFRVYPTPGQRVALAQAFGCARVVYNDNLRAREAAHAAGVKLSDTELQRQVVTEAKRTPQRSWLSQVSSVVLVQACQDARTAYRNWFDSLSGKRKGPSSANRGSGPGRTIGKRSGSPATVSVCERIGSCTWPRSVN